ncbi:MAG: hypothetical protein ABIZ04_07545, partial [Opitutus sp.]
SSTSLYPWPAKRDALDVAIASFTENWDANQLAFRAASSPPKPAEHGEDRVHVLSDFGPDGHARHSTVFADGLNIPVGIMPLPRASGSKGDSVISYSIPTIWRLTDTDGDGVADHREPLYTGFGFKDTHGMSSNYNYWVDGWIYGTHGFANHSEVRDRAGNLTVLDSGNTYRFKPDGSSFEQWTWGQTNPFGLTFDSRGDIYTADSHSKPVYLVQPRGYYEGISKKHDGLGFAPAITADDHGSSAIAGIAFYAADNFPAEYRGNLFNGNPVTGRVNRDRLEWTGSSPRAVRMPDFVSSDDPVFRPVQVKLGPDGALWIADFYNPIIGHYEVPLTHPNRDHAHGRIWRVVWRGLNREIPAPTLPNFGSAGAEALVQLLADPNLAVRTLAANELVDRVGPAALPELRNAAKTALAQPNTPAALAIANTMERLGAGDDSLLFETLLHASDNTGIAALRILANRADLGGRGEVFFRALLAQTQPGFVWRGIAEVFARHPATWQAPLLLQMRERTPDNDEQLVYAIRLALKASIADATLEELTSFEAINPHAGAVLASVGLAVPRPLIAEYLLGYLQRIQFKADNAGELARHAVQYLPPARYDAISVLVESLQGAPLAQQLALAEGLALAAADKSRPLPAEVESWMKRVLVENAAGKDWLLARRALDAAKPILFPEMTAVVRRLSLDPKIQQYPLRDVALRTLPAVAENEVVFDTVLNDGVATTTLRKIAAEALGKVEPRTSAESALIKALPGASSDLALSIAIALAKSDTGAPLLVGEVAAEKVPARLLTHSYVAPALLNRGSELQARVAQLTANLPSENARLDAVIAARAMAYGRARPSLTRGGAVFTEQCAVCHKLRNTGGSIGPSLDGLASRGVSRLMEDILDPSRNIDPTFRLSTVTLRNGETRMGMNLQPQGDSLTLNDVAGQPITLAKHDVSSVVPVPTSLMPGVFETTLSQEDLFSLINYLISPAAK